MKRSDRLARTMDRQNTRASTDTFIIWSRDLIAV